MSVIDAKRSSAQRIFRRWWIAALVVTVTAGLLLIDPCDFRNRGAAAVPVAAGSVDPATPSSVDPVEPVTSSAAPTTVSAPSVAEVLPTAVANAAAVDVEQAVAVIDRKTGQLVASHAGDTAFNAESIGKLLTAAYYLVETNGAPDAGLADDLESLITESNNHIQTLLWNPDIIPSMADRYQLNNTFNSPSVSSETWGSDQITANDQVSFLYAMSQEPTVGPQLMGWMSETARTGGDGFDQFFGFNTLTGDHGSKQGWSDPGWSPANLHSVGWTERYFAAILQTSPTATYATMRSTSTATATLIATAR
jgi:hypothetical protein